MPGKADATTLRRLPKARGPLPGRIGIPAAGAAGHPLAKVGLVGGWGAAGGYPPAGGGSTCIAIEHGVQVHRARLLANLTVGGRKVQQGVGALRGGRVEAAPVEVENHQPVTRCASGERLRDGRASFRHGLKMWYRYRAPSFSAPSFGWKHEDLGWRH